MKKSTLLTTFSILFVFVFTCSSFATVTIMPCGDSITYDNYSGDTRPSSERTSYRSHLWYMLQDGGYDVDFVGSVTAGEAIVPPFDPNNEGHPGWTDDQIADNIYNWLLSTPADIVLLHIGTNALNTSPDDVNDILNEIDDYEAFTGKHVTVLLARIINRMSYSSDTTLFNDNVEALAELRIAAGDDIIMVDMEDGAGINYATDMVDNLHPNDTGYQKMADLWYTYLIQILTPNCPESMTHYYKLEKAASPYEDFIADTNAICVGGICPTQTTGIVGNGLLFDSNDLSEVDIADDDTFDWDPNDSFTIEFWMKKSIPVGSGGTTDNEVIVGRDDAATDLHWWIGVQNTTGGARFQLRDTDNEYMAALEGPAVDDGGWHHIAAVRDGATDDIRLYVDGVLEDSDNHDWTAGFDSAGAPMNIGWMNLAPNYYHDGILDELAIYNSALSAAEIESHYNAGLAGKSYCDAIAIPDETDCPDGMVSYWKLEEASGDIAYDSFGPHDADGSVGTPTWGATGIVGSALSFDGTGDYLTVPDNAAFDWAADDSFTVELWAKFTNVASRNKVMIGRDEGPGSPHWWLGAKKDTGLPVCNLIDSGGSGVAITGTTAINDDDWHHVVFVRDESLDENRLYVDGASAATPVSYNYTADFAASTPLGIGFMAYNLTPDYYYDGLLDEIAIYNRALSDAEISQHYADGLAGEGYCTGAEELFSLKINCGGPTVVDGDVTWEAGSTYVTGGADYDFGLGAVDTTTNSIAAPVPTLDVYNKVRHQSPHSYNIPQAPDGDYIVRIHWMDHWGGDRQMDYEIEGVLVEEDWDIVAEAGAVDTAIDKEYLVTVSDGDGMQIVVSKGEGNDAFESAIEITQLETTTEEAPVITSTAPDTATVGLLYSYDVEATGDPAPTFSLSTSPAGMTIDDTTGLIEWTPASIGVYDVNVIAENGVDPNATQFFTITVSEAPPFSLKINCGGPTVVDGAYTWEAGSTYVTGGSDYTFSTSSVDTTTNSIAEPVPPLDVYKTCRHTSPHTYDIPQVPDGAYVVRIHWTDQATAAGLRDIDYDIEGVRVQEDWDIYAEAGGQFIAIDKEYIVTVSDGDGMQIVSSAASGDAFESAIEITALAPFAPVITSIPVTEATACMPYSYDVDATGWPAPTYSLSEFPVGMTIDPNTGLIEWTPDVLGVVDVNVVADNGEDFSDDFQSFTITVTDAGPYPSSMVGYWPMDETSGAPYVDVIAGNDATCSACPTPSTGTVDGAQYFNLANKVSIPDDGSFDWAADDSWTIEFWMKTSQTSPPRNMVIIGRDGGPTSLHWWIGTDSGSGKIRFQLRDTSNNGPYLGDKGPVLDDGVWHHIACVRDESLNENRVYVDGSLADSGVYDYTADFVESVPVQVGYIELSNWYYYDGHLDELALHDRALELTEIQTHYTDGLAGKAYAGDGIDTDGDGVSDCVDGCPNDPNKIEPGDCGCGVPDTDTDEDGVPDCIDGCPDDPNKTEPGDCGCGVEDTDTDEDGIADCIDNCPDIDNSDQADGDGDDVGDVCDNCEETSNPAQEDSDTDGIGDACECTRANVNAAGSVDLADFAIVAEVWMTSDAAGDLDKDGDVDFNDMMQIAEWWLADCL